MILLLFRAQINQIYILYPCQNVDICHITSCTYFVYMWILFVEVVLTRFSFVKKKKKEKKSSKPKKTTNKKSQYWIIFLLFPVVFSSIKFNSVEKLLCTILPWLETMRAASKDKAEGDNINGRGKKLYLKFIRKQHLTGFVLYLLVSAVQWVERNLSNRMILLKVMK